MKSMPDNLPDDLQLLKQMLAKMQSRVGFLEEENALLRQRLFGRKSEQTADPATPQLALFNEAESVVEGKRSINLTWLKIGKAFSCEVEVRSSTVARLRNPLPMSPLANV
ncbi:transposase, partial [Pseudomonas viridiflava]|uniref:transposase n=1 Tax=Pseudomonas viridiflava TaxID=33069 RepID=UPI001F142507